jgi:phosphoserine phosphatase
LVILYVVRHGESVYNAEGRVQGHKDVPLSELGVRQAEAISKRLAAERIDAVYSSDLVRASRTGEIIATWHGLAVETTPLLRESCLGVIEGMTRAEIEAKYSGTDWIWNPLTARPPGAETIEQVIDRARRFLQDTLPKHADGSRILIAGHGGSVRGVIVAGLGLSTDFYRRFHFANASLSIIEVGEHSAFRLLNDTCHLNSIVTEEETDGL